MKIPILLFLLIFISGCQAVDDQSCTQDLDCVPATCCHPSSCINKENAPDCENIVCTMECVPDTLDCGQGSCACINNKCEVIIK